MRRKIFIFLLCVALTTPLLGCRSETIPADVLENKATTESVQPEQPTLPRRLIHIKGPDQFVTDVTAALDLIAERTPVFYEDIQKYVTMILLEELGEDDFKTGGWANGIGWIYVTDYLYDWLKETPSDFLIPEYELARMLVHETVHIRQFREGRLSAGRIENEREALAVEREFLRALGVDPDLIEQASGEHKLDNPWWQE